MEVRPFTPEDVVWASPLADLVFTGFDDGYGDQVAAWAGDPHVVGWTARLDRPVGFVLVAELGLVGDHATKVLDVLALAVDPAFRRRGFGRSLLATVLREARYDGAVREVRLVSDPDDLPSAALFRQARFTVARADDGSFPSGRRATRWAWHPRPGGITR